MKRCFVAISLLLLTAMGNSQETGEADLGSWFMYFGTNKVSNRLSVHTEAQFRYYEVAKNFNQLLLRTGLNYHINPDAIATLGYGYIDTDPLFGDSPKDADLKEHRIFQQFILKNKVWKLLFEHRYRLEQRFISQTNILTDPEENLDRTEHRVRYRIQMTFPLSQTFFLNFYDEIFINLQNDAFGQNRLYAALGVRLSGNLSVQAGYLKNHFNAINFDRLQLGVFYNPDLRGLFKKGGQG